MQRATPQQSGSTVMVGNGGDNVNSTFVHGENLHQASVPVDTLLGAANGAVKGATVGGAGAVAVSFIEHASRGGAGTETVARLVMRNLTKPVYLGAVIATTAAFSGLGAVVRYSQASKHNEWSERQYALLEQSQQMHQERLQNERDTTPQGVAKG